MTRKALQAVLLASIAACSQAPPADAQSAQRPFTATEVARFSTPWAMDFLPGSGVRMTNMALVTEKEGKLWLVNTSDGSRQAVSGVPVARVAGQGGLGDVVAHPDFAGNQRVYLSFVQSGPNETSGAALGYGRLIMGRGAPRLEGFKIIWRQTPKVTDNGHFAHRIAFAPDGTIFLSSGDRQKMQPAQDPGSDLGKIVHLTAEGQRVGGRFHTMGHRNPLGLSFAADGRLWSVEMGPAGGDELNLIVQGRNYGWPEASYGSHYEGADIPDDHKGRGFEEPKVWWNPVISPGGMIIYSGELFPQWKGDALIAGLSGQNFVRVDIDGDKARKADAWDMGSRIRAVDQGPRGEVYLLEDGRGGSGARLLRLEPVQARR